MTERVMYTRPAGLDDGNVEFFAIAPFKVKALYSGQVFHFKELPTRIRSIITKRRCANRYAQFSFDSIGITDEIDRDERFAYCLYGAFDNVPDIDVYRNITNDEYRVCAGKHTCPYPVKFCVQKINTPTGEKLAPREIQLVQLIAQGFSYKEICQKMFITEGTLITYRSHVYYKLEAHKQSDVTRFALLNNLI